MIYAILANTPSIIVIYLIINNRLIRKNQIIDAFLGAFIAYIAIYILGGLFNSMFSIIENELLSIIIGTFIEEVIKIFGLVCFSKNIFYKYQIILYGLIFTVIENFAFSHYDISISLIRALIFFVHPATLIIFVYILYRWKKKLQAKCIGITCCFSIHLLHNLQSENMIIVVFSFYLVILFNITKDIFKNLPKCINIEHNLKNITR